MKKRKYKALCKKLKQPKANYFGCFTELGHKDKRLKKFVQERKEFGFDESELWSLRSSIANFTLPRLKKFAEIHISTPANMSAEEWQNKLNSMILALEYCVTQLYDHSNPPSEQMMCKIDQGFKDFGEYFLDLWD